MLRGVESLHREEKEIKQNDKGVQGKIEQGKTWEELWEVEELSRDTKGKAKVLQSSLLKT